MNLKSSKGSARGTQVSQAMLADIQHWSETEHVVATTLLADATVREVYCQFPTVEFVDEFGEVHTHRFDYFVIYHDGTALAINVKLSTEAHVTEKLFVYLDECDLAFEYICVTELEATQGCAANARAILDARENYNHADYAEALQALVGIHGNVLFHSLLKGARNPADRREALWNLIDRGVLVILDETERVCDYTYIGIDHDELAEELKTHAQSAA